MDAVPAEQLAWWNSVVLLRPVLLSMHAQHSNSFTDYDELTWDHW